MLQDKLGTKKIERCSPLPPQSSKKMLTIFVMAMLFATPSLPQNRTEMVEKELCSTALPLLFQLVDALSGVPESFTQIYGDMSQEQQTRFTEVDARGKALVEAAKDYRKSFIDACFGS
jgi:hypothetical protein